MNQSPFKIWILAIRPKTLPASIAPVFIATAMAFGDGIHHFPTAILCLAGALAIQIGTNLANDYYDFKKGVDTPQRLGPVRVTQAGLIPPSSVKLAFMASFGLSALACAWLVMRAGWLLAVLGVLAILSGILYTAGPRPLGYRGWGDALVLIFFGPVAVGATYYVQSFEMNAAVLMAGLAPGLLSVAILTVNNLRDMEGDQRAGKKTLAVRFGRSFVLSEYLFCVLGASVMPVFIYIFIQDHLAILTSVLTALAAIPAIKTVLTKMDGPSLNLALASTGKLLLVYSVLFSLGWLL
jgi:1,4-dihydroxy-2-naphthoate octaprenyltransferase